MSDELTVAVTETGTTTSLVVRGPLSLRTSAALSAALRKHLLDRGRVLVDVSELSLLWRPAAAVFATSLEAVGGWPAARLALFGARGELAARLDANGSRSGVHLAANADDAAALLERRPARVRRSIDLHSTVQAPALARLLLADVCADWDLDEAVLQRAVQVVNELVTNAVEHSVGQHTLRLVLDARGLGVAVDDSTPAEHDLRARARLGLAVVEELSDAWGVAPSRKGKSVWALLRLSEEESR